MELKRYATLLRKSWWIVALVVIVAVGSAYGISKVTTPTFRATVVLGAGASVSASGNASNIISLTQGVLNQYARELGSRTLAQKASEALQLDLPAERLQSAIKAVPTNQDLTIRVDVEDRDPHRARDIANKLAALFVQEKEAAATKAAAVLGGQHDTILVSVIDPAITPARPFKPNTRVNMVAAAILGLLLGVLIVLLADWIDDTVRGPGDAEMLLDTRILAAIPQLSKPRPKRGRGHQELISTLSRT